MRKEERKRRKKNKMEVFIPLGRRENAQDRTFYPRIALQIRLTTRRVMITVRSLIPLGAISLRIILYKQDRSTARSTIKTARSLPKIDLVRQHTV